MPASQSIEGMIQDLGQNLVPVKPLRPPMMRAAFWLSVVGLFGLGLAIFAPVGAVTQRLLATPDMRLAVLGSTLTSVLGAIAVFHLSVPGRKAAWALLPLPALLLWLGASGMGCLREWIIPGTHDASMTESRDCLVFILGVSAPLSVLMIVMMRRAFPLRPGLTASVAGLACAAAAATLLNFFHPYDASATDLAVHFAAVGLVVGLHRLGSTHLLPRLPK